MKKLFYLALVTLIVQACSVSYAGFVSGPKNLIQNSDFAIVTPKHDTLFLCHEDATGKLLAELWSEGKFKDGPQPILVLLNCQNFEKLVTRISPNTTMASSAMNP